MITQNRIKTVLTIAAVAMAVIVGASMNPVSAAMLTLDETVEVSFDKSEFNISVYPGKASYSGFDGTVTGVFGDGTVLGYRFFNSDGLVLSSYADDGTGIVAPVVSPDAADLDGSESWANVWTTTDPGVDFAIAADITEDTLARGRNITGTIDISDLSSGTAYVIFGGIKETVTLTVTMSGAGQTDIQAEYSIDLPTDKILGKNYFWVASFDFSDAGGYETITYTYTISDLARRGRFVGVIIDNVVSDANVPDVDAGENMISWSGQMVELDPNIVETPGSNWTNLTYLWSPDPCDGVVFEPNRFVEEPTVTINKSEIPITVTRTIQAETDDVEEYLNTIAIHGQTGYPQGGMDLSSGDLEVGDDDDGLFWQVCAVQYDQLAIPQGSTINSAKLTFQVDEAGTPRESNDFTILAEAADDASVFSADPFNVTSRARTTASVGWDPNTAVAVGKKVDTPDISALIQEVVNRPGWSDNNRLTLMIYPDVYLALPDPNTGGSTLVSSNVYEAGPGLDSATLTVEFKTTSPTPMPVTVTLCLAVNNKGNPPEEAVTSPMTIDVYDNACLAALASGLIIDPTDFDENCITNFVDFAVLGGTWLDDYRSTGPVIKP